MSPRHGVPLVAVWCLSGIVYAGAQPAAAPNRDEAAIRTLVAEYARAVDAADTSLAAAVWASTPDISFIHPRGHEHGWDGVKRFYEQTMGANFSARRLTIKDLAIHCYGETAWAEFYWDFAATLRKDGSPVETHGRETQIYRKLQDGWRLVHVHYSAMPVAVAVLD